MNRRAFLTSAGCAISCARDIRPRLNVYNWSTYIDPEMLRRFERERGVRVRYGTYESNEEMLARIASGNSGWDVVFPTHSRLQPMFRRGLLMRLDHTRLGDLKNLDPAFQKPTWDPGLQWGIPYMWNATGIAFNRTIADRPERWEFLWRDSLAGRITMLDDPEDVLGACLLKLGFSFDSVSGDELNAAKQEAIRQKRLLRAYVNADVRDQLVAGDVLAAQLWSTTAAQAIHTSGAGAPLAFVYPGDGFPLYCDCAAILAESERGPLAHDFLAFLLRPEVAAANARAADSATANVAARALLPNDEVLYPSAAILSRGHWPVPLTSAQLRLRNNIWTAIKAA